EQLGDQVVLVPILRGSHIWNPGEDRLSRTLPVAGQNGLPDYEDAQLLALLLLEQSFDGGGPPHAGLSAGGEQKQHSGFVGCVVEGRVEAAQILTREIR